MVELGRFWIRCNEFNIHSRNGW